MSTSKKKAIKEHQYLDEFQQLVDHEISEHLRENQYTDIYKCIKGPSLWQSVKLMFTNLDKLHQWERVKFLSSEHDTQIVIGLSRMNPGLDGRYKLHQIIMNSFEIIDFEKFKNKYQGFYIINEVGYQEYELNEKRIIEFKKEILKMMLSDDLYKRITAFDFSKFWYNII